VLAAQDESVFERMKDMRFAYAINEKAIKLKHSFSVEKIDYVEDSFMLGENYCDYSLPESREIVTKNNAKAAYNT
jgi:hypothetical protein